MSSPMGVSVISDLDDTIKVTEVTNKKQVIKNTFLRPFRAVDGMAKLYMGWADLGVQFHYVSSSPWQLYKPLRDFARDDGFPDATFHLKRVRFKDASLLKMFADPLKTKPPVIERFLEVYPKRKFLLIGDSGEKDPEVYATIAHKFPQQIQRIYIRDITGETADSPRYQAAFENLPKEKWSLFHDPQTLELPEELPEE